MKNTIIYSMLFFAFLWGVHHSCINENSHVKITVASDKNIFVATRPTKMTVWKKKDNAWMATGTVHPISWTLTRYLMRSRTGVFATTETMVYLKTTAISPDSKHIATASFMNKGVFVYSTDSLELEAHYDPELSYITGLQFISDDEILSVGPMGSPTIYDLRTKQIRNINIKSEGPDSYDANSISSDAKFYSVLKIDEHDMDRSHLSIRKTSDHETIKSYPFNQLAVFCKDLIFTPDSQKFIIKNPKEMALYDFSSDSNSPVWTKEYTTRRLSNIDFSSDGIIMRIDSSDKKQAVMYVNILTGEVLPSGSTKFDTEMFYSRFDKNIFVKGLDDDKYVNLTTWHGFFFSPPFTTAIWIIALLAIFHRIISQVTSKSRNIKKEELSTSI